MNSFKFTVFLFLFFNFSLEGQITHISEFSYEDPGADQLDFVEVYIPNPQPTSLVDYQIELYNGKNAKVYLVRTLDEFVEYESNKGSFYVLETSLQNGSPDGIALSVEGTLLEFLSYEGEFEAVDGTASGVVSTNVLVSEGGGDDIDQSIQWLDGKWSLGTKTKGFENALLNPTIEILNECNCSEANDVFALPITFSQTIQIIAPENQKWEIIQQNGILNNPKVFGGLTDAIDNDEDGSIDETDEKNYYSIYVEQEKGVAASMVFSNGAVDRNWNSICDNINSCTQTIFDAQAICNDIDSRTFNVQIQNLQSGLDLNQMDSIVFEVENQKFLYTGSPIVSDEINHSGQGGNILSVSVKAYKENELLIDDYQLVSEVLCGDSQNEVVCACETDDGEFASITAQSQPGTFAIDNHEQWYLLLEEDRDKTILEANQTGFFDNLENGVYEIIALNIEKSSLHFFDTYINLSEPTHINFVELQSQVGSFDGACYSLCGMQQYEVACGCCDLNTADIFTKTSFNVCEFSDESERSIFAKNILRINEIDVNQAGVDTEEFIEILGPSNISLDGYAVFLVNGSNNEIYEAYDLDGFVTNDDGLFLMSSSNIQPISTRAISRNALSQLIINKQNWLQNGTDAIVIARIDEVENIEIATLIGDVLIDGVVYGTSSNTVLETTFGSRLELDTETESWSWDGSNYIPTSPTPNESGNSPIIHVFDVYADDEGDLGTLLATGVDQFTPLNTIIGTSSYWVVIDDTSCFANPLLVSYTIENAPNTIEVFTSDLDICLGECNDYKTVLTADCNCTDIADGVESIIWYENETDEVPIFEGREFDLSAVLDLTKEGTFTFYATYDCGNGCPSPRVPANVNISSCESKGKECEYTLVMENMDSVGWGGDYLNINGQKYELVDAFVQTFSIDIAEVEDLKIDYVGTHNDSYAYSVFNAKGERIAAIGTKYGALLTQPNAVSVSCEPVCSSETNAQIFITADEFIENASFELMDAYSKEIIVSKTADELSVLNKNDTIWIPVSIPNCSNLNLIMTDTYGQDWNGEFYIFTNNVSRGIENNNFDNDDFKYELFYTDGDFNDGSDTFLINIPCEPICPNDTLIRTSGDCELISFEPQIPEPIVCFENTCQTESIFYSIEIPTATKNSDGTFNISVGIHIIYYEMTYANGQMYRCQSELKILSEENPKLICNDQVSISLADECEYQLEVDDLLEGINACEGDYVIQVKEGNKNGVNLGNKVDASWVGKNLIYEVWNIENQNNYCWGNLLVEDKRVPILVCEDAEVSCTNPNRLDAFYTQIDTLVARNSDLPMNINGGSRENPSISELYFDFDKCNADEVVKDIIVHLEIEHNDLEDLQIKLISPNEKEIVLLPFLTCENEKAAHLNIVFDENKGGVLTCSDDKNYAINGIFKPYESFKPLIGVYINDLQGIWTLQIIDNDSNQNENIGYGQLVSAAIEITSGFEIPQLVSSCLKGTIRLANQKVQATNCTDLGYSSTITRNWEVVAQNGFRSNCQQKVYVKTPYLSDVQFPENIKIESSQIQSTNPKITGFPTFNCYSMETEINSCNWAVSYSDTEFKGCGNEVKIIRNWTIFNTCTGVSIDSVQTILSEGDNIRFSIANQEIGMSRTACSAEGSLVFDAINYDNIDALTATTSFDRNEYTFDLLNKNIEGLPEGIHELEITATNKCGKAYTQTIFVEVVDDKLPIPISNRELHLTLGDNGEAVLKAIDFDEGSFDNCGLKELLIKRETGCIFQLDFEDEATFDCCDAGKEVKVELKAIDVNGNENTTWGTVLVEDYQSPKLVCPNDTIITCDDFEKNGLTGLGQPYFTDNCELFLVSIPLPDEYATNNKGYEVIRRSWYVKEFGNTKTQADTCSQIITIIPTEEFSVIFPDSILTIYDCNSIIDSDKPIIKTASNCQSIYISMEDDTLSQECLIINRKWTIINFSTYEANETRTDGGTYVSENEYLDDGDGYFYFEQTINIIDTVSPVWINPMDTFKVSIQTNTCKGFANPNIPAMDNCSLTDTKYFLDKDNEGSFNNEFPLELEVGNYNAIAKSVDRCGNVAQHSFVVSVVDDKKPTPICYASISSQAMETDGTLSLKAVDFLKDATDNCTVREDLFASAKLALHPDSLFSEELTITCTEIYPNESVILYLQIEDNAENNQYCQFEMNIIDPGGYCYDLFNISGQVQQIGGTFMEDVDIMMNQESITQSSQEGNYLLDNLALSTYEVEAAKKSELLKDVSVLDLVYIRQHILGIKPFENNSQWVAGDINNDGKVTVFDILSLTQTLLGRNEAFPNNNSYRFYTDSLALMNLGAYKEMSYKHRFVDLNKSHREAHFYGVKVGDVSGATHKTAQSRATSQLMVPNKVLSIGEEEMLPITIDEGYYQGGQLFFDLNEIEIVAIDFLSGFISDYEVIDNQLRLVFYPEEDNVFVAEKPLFNLIVKSKASQKTQDAINLSNNNSSMLVQSRNEQQINLRYQNIDNFTNINNFPNPFDDFVNIVITSSKKVEGKLKIYDAKGQLLWVKSLIISDERLIVLGAEVFNYSGVYYYEFETPNSQLIGRVVKI